ncbi:hypothetical protein BC834DRAFT_273349 [Gloeopeniophorella convolvens]|nr:hypothetical protein BC834DRAFT_273349 [Gloeopeniophorella convolvens]
MAPSPSLVPAREPSCGALRRPEQNPAVTAFNQLSDLPRFISLPLLTRLARNSLPFPRAALCGARSLLSYSPHNYRAAFCILLAPLWRQGRALRARTIPTGAALRLGAISADRDDHGAGSRASTRRFAWHRYRAKQTSARLRHAPLPSGYCLLAPVSCPCVICLRRPPLLIDVHLPSYLPKNARLHSLNISINI